MIIYILKWSDPESLHVVNWLELTINWSLWTIENYFFSKWFFLLWAGEFIVAMGKEIIWGIKTDGSERKLSRRDKEITFKEISPRGRSLFRLMKSLNPLKSILGLATCQGTRNSSPLFIRKRFPYRNGMPWKTLIELIGPMSTCFPLQMLRVEIVPKYLPFAISC